MTTIKKITSIIIGIIGLCVNASLANAAAATANTALDTSVGLHSLLSVIPSALLTPYAAQMQLTTNSGVIHQAQLRFYSSADCSPGPSNTNVLGNFSIVDNGDDALAGVTFNASNTIAVSATGAYIAATATTSNVSNIACMQVYLDGGNESPNGASCQNFAESCGGGTCTTTTSTPLVPWSNNPTACATRYAYVANKGGMVNTNANTISTCTISASTGLLSDCTSSNALLNMPQGIDVNNGFLYSSNEGSGTDVTQFQVSAADGSLGTSAANHTFNQSTDVTLNGQYAYVTLNTPSNNLIQCTVNQNQLAPSTPQLSNCSVSGATQNFSYPAGIAFNAGYAYIANNYPNNNNPTVTQCNVNPNTGVLSNCSQENISNYLWVLNFNVNSLTINNGYVYLTSKDSNILLSCPIQKGGSLTSCSQMNYGNPQATSAPGALGFFSNSSDGNDYAYLSDFLNDYIYRCTINLSNGTLQKCTQITDDSDFNAPSGIAIY